VRTGQPGRNPNFEMDHLGNLTDGPVPVPLDLVAPHLYPGAKVELGPDWHVQLVSYPEQKNNGNWQFAAIQVGDPENALPGQFGNAPMGRTSPATCRCRCTWTPSRPGRRPGSDGDKINALFNTAKVEDQNPVDHHAQMTDQGIPFGTAGYPIYFNEPSGTYFRRALRSSGVGRRGRDLEQRLRHGRGQEKVWDGVPFTGQLKVPDTIPGSFLGQPESYGNPLDYKPEARRDWSRPPRSTWATGNSRPRSSPTPTATRTARRTWSTAATSPRRQCPKKTSFQAAGQLEGHRTSPTHGHSSTTRSRTPRTPVDTVTHHEGPQPPADLGAKLQSLGYTPSPGDTLWVKLWTPGRGAAGQAGGRHLPQDPVQRHLGTHVFTPEDLKNYDVPGHGQPLHLDLPPGRCGRPGTVQGLPDGFAPYVPGDGQALLKVTLPNGKQNVYLQKQPGAGWYEMGPDGTVRRASDAVKSDFVVQQKLAGKGSQAAKYELLHPLPEGVKPTGQTVPTLTNHGGDWTPDPHQKVVALSSHEGDTDPWFFVQDTPGGQWMPAPNTVDSGLDNGVTDAAIQGKLEQEGNWKLVYDGNGHAAVDAPDKTLPPTFTDPLDASYTPKEGEEGCADLQRLCTTARGQDHQLRRPGRAEDLLRRAGRRQRRLQADQGRRHDQPVRRRHPVPGGLRDRQRGVGLAP
jgi:hypothetical protein